MIETMNESTLDRLRAELAAARQDERFTRADIRRLRKEIARAELPGKIARFEERHPQSALLHRAMLVRVGESVEAWHARLSALDRAYASWHLDRPADREFLEARWRKGGVEFQRDYVKWLLAADDPRVRGTVLYARHQRDRGPS